MFFGKRLRKARPMPKHVGQFYVLVRTRFPIGRQNLR
uniref:Ribosomal protein L16 n=1 Tax=Romanomermis culicivorax TaxID=13658 RepID=A0A915IJG6_ROMCU